MLNNTVMCLLFGILILMELTRLFSLPIYRKVTPKIIFRVHEPIYSELHQSFKEVLNRTVHNNTEYCIVYFDKDDRLDFINRFYPRYLEAYNDTIPGAFKADIFRQLVVYRYGGIYNDLSIDYLVPIDTIVRDSDQFVGVISYQIFNLWNGFFACYERCPSIGHMIVTMMNKVFYQQYGNHVLSITGPAQFGSAFRNFYANRKPFFLERYGRFIPGTYNITGDSSSFQFLRYGTSPLIKDKAVVFNISGDALMTNKFKDSESLLYRHGQGKYLGYYFMNAMYQNGVHTLTKERVKHMLEAGIRLKGLEGNLIGSGQNESTIWYVMNSTRRCFPDMATFKNLRFDGGNLLKKVPLEIIEIIPIGTCFSKNLSISAEEVQSHFFLPNYLETLTKVNQTKMQLFIKMNKGNVIEYKDFVSFVE